MPACMCVGIGLDQSETFVKAKFLNFFSSITLNPCRTERKYILDR